MVLLNFLEHNLERHYVEIVIIHNQDAFACARVFSFSVNEFLHLRRIYFHWMRYQSVILDAVYRSCLLTHASELLVLHVWIRY
jgi:hypothetical protein